MNYSCGDRVIYGGCQMCVVGGIEQKSFDGVNFNDYVKLTPVDNPNSSYFIQYDRIDERVRSLLPKEKVLELIDNMTLVEGEWIPDRSRRRNEFAEALKGEDYGRILSMIKSLSTEKKRRQRMGKGLMTADEKALEQANRLISNEFSAVLEITPDTLNTYILERTGTAPVWQV